MVKISVIVPVFNTENYLKRCLESLVTQTLNEIEIIIVNDGSKDKSKEIIEEYMERYKDKIKYYEKENGGLSSARNYGMKFASGEYIAFLDSDDYAENNMYEEMYNLALKENADMCECDFIWQWKKKKKIDKRKKYKNKSEILRKPRVVAWNKIIKRSIIVENNIQFPEGIIYEDIEFFFKIMPYINIISYINKSFVHYIQRENSISNVQTEKTADIFKVIENIFNFYKEKDLYKRYEKELKYMCKRILLGSSMKRILKIRNSKLRRKMLLKSIIYLFRFGTDIYEKNNISKEKKQLCFGITKLGIGGAERVLVDLVNELQQFYDITIFTIYAKGELEKDLDKNIKLVNLYNKENKNRIIPLYIFLLKKNIYNKYIRNKYDIDIAFLEGPITRIFKYKGNEKNIAWVHNDIEKVFGDDFKSKTKRYIDKLSYIKYDKIIFVSEQNKKSFEKIYGNISERKVIYNYINKDRIIKLSNIELHDKEMNQKEPSPMEQVDQKEPSPMDLCMVSRLVKQKGIDRFIRVHKRLIDEGFFHNVYVIGDGEEKNNLMYLVKNLNVEDTFRFLGKKENPYPFIKKADFFTLLSNYEGYGMVIEEAKILNKPIVITNTAAVEAVRDYDKKLIIDNNEESIYKELKKLLSGKYNYLNNNNNKYEYNNKYLIEEVKKIL